MINLERRNKLKGTSIFIVGLVSLMIFGISNIDKYINTGSNKNIYSNDGKLMVVIN